MRRVVLAASLLLLMTAAAFACGIERQAVKTGTDLGAIQAPPDPNVQPNARFGPTEMTVFAISGMLTVIKREKDEDYHLVIVDLNDPTWSTAASMQNLANSALRGRRKPLW